MGLSAAAPAKPFSFILLGDLQYDSLAHHDMKWLQDHHAGDLSQIQNYSPSSWSMAPRWRLPFMQGHSQQPSRH